MCEFALIKQLFPISIIALSPHVSNCIPFSNVHSSPILMFSGPIMDNAG